MQTSTMISTPRRGLAQGGSFALHLILSMTNVHRRVDAEERRCGDAESNRLTKTAVQAGNPNPVSVLSQYSYDPIYELTQAVVNGTVAESYSYDAVGNRLTSAGPTSYSYNVSNELTSTSSATYTYDNNGNTTSKTTSAGTTSYTWDFENRLSSVTLPGTGGTVNFQYDPFGRRIYKSAPSGTSIYVYDGNNIIQELGAAGNLLASYTQGLGVDEPLAMYQGLTTDYFQADGLGSITSLTDPTGTVAASYVYDSFGNLTASTGSVINPLQYTGREFDSETGLYYYRARYYDPLTGRFLSEDPLRLGPGSSWYPYVSNNPASAVDPLGLSGPDVHLLSTFSAANMVFGPKCEEKARIVASADEAEDDIHGLGALLQFLTGRGQAWARPGPHFPNQAILNEREKQAFDNCDPAALGRYLHSPQDFIAHSGYFSSPTVHYFVSLPYVWTPYDPVDNSAELDKTLSGAAWDVTVSTLQSFKSRCLKCCN
jgi:RHS repeat-associated protein